MKFAATKLAMGLGLAVAVGQAGDVRADAVLDWNATLLDTVRALPANPVVQSRAMAMVNTAIYDAVNAATGFAYASYAFDGGGIGESSADAAAAAAAHSVLAALYPARAPQLLAAYNTALAAIPDSAAKTNGVTLGQLSATAILALRSADGSSTVVPYVPGAAPGDWRPTPPGFLPAAFPNWPGVTPWAMTSGDQFRPGGPPALGSAAYAAAFNETKSLGKSDSATRTADQTEIALFWSDNPGTATPPGHWLDIAMKVSAAQGLSLSENARLFALLGIAVADAAIVCWDAKYFYEFWRPVTAIANAATDGNPLTEADPDWLPLIVTPNFPEYTSGHSTFSSAAAEILALFFANDEIAFTIGSDGLPGVFRDFDSFSEAAQEAGRSRIYGGIHYEFSNQDAQASGRALADFIFESLLEPVRVSEPPMLWLFVAAAAVLLLLRGKGRKRR
ncbi:MAG: vanadium-dependent haloperoxidase [Alphaproteobacteria bacterium]